MQVSGSTLLLYSAELSSVCSCLTQPLLVAHCEQQLSGMQQLAERDFRQALALVIGPPATGSTSGQALRKDSPEQASPEKDSPEKDSPEKDSPEQELQCCCLCAWP